MAINAAWHKVHRMPANASMEQRIAWHAAHQRKCACREMPKTVRQAIGARSRGGGRKR